MNGGVVKTSKYFVEVSTDTSISKKEFNNWASSMELSEQGGEKRVDRWYNFPFTSIKEARKFKSRVKKEFSEGIDMVRIFKVVLHIHEECELVE